MHSPLHYVGQASLGDSRLVEDAFTPSHAEHTPAKVLGDTGESVLSLLELLEKLVVLRGVPPLLLLLLLHAHPLRRTDNTLVLAVREAGLVE